MKPTLAALAISLPLLAGHAAADTTSSDQDRAIMEQKASPSAPIRQDEEQAEAHSRPDTPASTGGSTVRLPLKQDEDKDSQGNAKTDKPASGDHYQSNENKADSTKSAQ